MREGTFRSANRHIGFVFQFHQLCRVYGFENVMIPAFIAGRGQQEAKEAATENLEFMGLERPPTSRMSCREGEKNNVAVARAHQSSSSGAGR